ncbi:MAG: MarR family winged helix-turn-helix transcriptional regulator [Hyphomicrobium sp.]
MKREKSSLSYELLQLDNQLCFALYAATRAIAKTYRVRLAPMGLTYPQYLVLIVLWEADGLTVSDIGERLFLDSGTLTPLIKRLEMMKLVKRKRSKTDEREVEVSLTAKGAGLRNDALDARKYVACRLQMSERQIMALRGELMAMIGRLGDECAADAAE